MAKSQDKKTIKPIIKATKKEIPQKTAKGPRGKSKPVLEDKGHPVHMHKMSSFTPQEKYKTKKTQISLPPTIYKGHVACVKTAKHYGFFPFEIEMEKSDIVKAKTLRDKNAKSNQGVLTFENFLDEKVALVRHFVEKKFQDLHQPPAICFSGPLKGNPFLEKTKEHIFNLDIIGNAKSIADAVVIETAYVILKEHHDMDELMVEVNSVGDKESFSRFTKEFTQYFKKHLSELPAELKTAFKKDPLSLGQIDHDSLDLLRDEAPKPIDYLSEESRVHFREVLEYLESLGLPYMINNSLIGTRHCSTGTVFQIVGIKESPKGEKRTLLAIGERYNSVAKKALGKKEVPAIGAHILVDDKEAKKSDTVIIEEEIKFYFIHLGYEAKLKSLTILEILRQSKISIHQSLAKDKITAQLQAAEKLGVPYILLVGQKEALENSVTVRHVETRVQETVHIDNLVEYLKKL
ncbi:MAG: hypothetical protein RIQ72_264 [Candidatus Parcubacteria bacterium]|jgi:histidyl-tRNA synthetase